MRGGAKKWPGALVFRSTKHSLSTYFPSGYRPFSYCILIIGDLNGLGHLPEFADQIEPKTRLDVVNFWSANSGKWPNPFRSRLSIQYENGL